MSKSNHSEHLRKLSSYSNKPNSLIHNAIPRNALVPKIRKNRTMSLTCKCLCQSQTFKEKFKVLKQISGKISWAIRRWYRYCSTCSLWLSMKIVGLCQFCNRKVRNNKVKSREASRRYYRTHTAEVRRRALAYYYRNREKMIAQRYANYHSKKK